MDAGLLEIFLASFIAMFVVVDPPGLAPVFAGLVDGTPARHKRSMALRGTFVATATLLFFAFVGEPFLHALGISLDALRVAGGILLFFIGFEMINEKREKRKQDSAEEIHEFFDDISVFPVAIPLTAGPGSIATIILQMAGQESNPMGQAAVLAGLGLTMLLTLMTFLAAGPIMNALGPTVNAVLTRVLGVIVCALSAQFVLDGIKGFWG